METLKLAENAVQFTSMSCNTKQKPSKTKHARNLVPREWIVMTDFKKALKKKISNKNEFKLMKIISCMHILYA